MFKILLNTNKSPPTPDPLKAWTPKEAVRSIPFGHKRIIEHESEKKQSKFDGKGRKMRVKIF